MEEDASTPGWSQRAVCRWVTYALLWTLSVCACLISAYHSVLRIVAGLLGCLLAISMPILFATLFEITYTRRARSDLPVICFPWLGSMVIAFGVFSLLQASSFLVSLLVTKNVDSVQTLCQLFAGKDRRELPRSVCIENAFIKTEWEAGKLRCQGEQGHVHCVPAFVAAPIFNSKVLSKAGLHEEIYAWAVTYGRHVDANYRRGGQLCGYLSGQMELDYHLGDYRLAVARVIQKHHLSLGQFAGGVQGAEAGISEKPIPLQARPLLLTADPLEVTHIEQAWLAVGLLLLCCCPCAGPAPVAALLVFACWTRRARHGHHPVAQDDYDEEDGGHATPWQGKNEPYSHGGEGFFGGGAPARMPVAGRREAWNY